MAQRVPFMEHFIPSLQELSSPEFRDWLRSRLLNPLRLIDDIGDWWTGKVTFASDMSELQSAMHEARQLVGELTLRGVRPLLCKRVLVLLASGASEEMFDIAAVITPRAGKPVIKAVPALVLRKYLAALRAAKIQANVGCHG